MQADPLPKIRPADRLLGHRILLRNVATSDAAFILSVRTDPNRNRHISTTVDDLEQQERWIEDCLRREQEAYFVIASLDGERLGTVRLYDPHGHSFCWGSWIIKTGAPTSTAIESALVVYEYALNELGFSSSHFQVHRDNASVIAFHERFGAKRVREDAYEIHFQIDRAAIMASISRYRRFLPDGIRIESSSRQQQSS